ncbi:uncharacterized protein V1510DRAFT_420949 [Dipodascopsis tothii]|uniref:uncharacterized protein n=1 Tax=Dipodascopsis tothii TaxID=44089 RepID=UPI0034CEC356
MCRMAPIECTSAPNETVVVREQGVEELLHMKMLESMLETPATMVLAVGEGSRAEFSEGFFKYTLVALQKGWKVEVYTFEGGASQTWLNRDFLDEWKGRFRHVFLDRYVDLMVAE